MNYTADFPSLGSSINYSIINTDGNSGVIGEVSNILQDSLSTSQLTATRHANGRDWWISVAHAEHRSVYSVHITPNGVAGIDTSDVDYVMQSGLGQSVFSPDGNTFAQINLVGDGLDPDYLDIFDFDRSTGRVSNHRQTILEGLASSGGIAISPSSQYLYVSRDDYIYQYDLWADDVVATKDTVATYDGYAEFGFLPTRFFLAQLAPDGKIYLNNSSAARHLHVIDHPDRAGTACNVRQHAINLPNFNAFTLANHPNYRLGPLDGSPADSLGLDNLPRAYYRTDRNADDTLAFHFQDLSFYEPADWSWSFGDGATSTDRHPDHAFAGPGIYEVCLTVSNDLGSDTECRTLELGPTSISEARPVQLTTFPNPVQDVLVFDLGDYLPLNGRFRLFDAAGREVFAKQVLYGQAQFRLGHLPAGMYYYSFRDGGTQIGAGKIVLVAN